MFTINSTELIAACGLYCGACKRYKRGKCPGCQKLDGDATGLRQPLTKGIQRCSIRKCSHKHAFRTCAECDTDVKVCKHYNTFISRLASYLFNSDRAACIRYIKHNGEERYAEKMSWDEQMTIRRSV